MRSIVYIHAYATNIHEFLFFTIRGVFVFAVSAGRDPRDYRGMDVPLRLRDRMLAVFIQGYENIP